MRRRRPSAKRGRAGAGAAAEPRTMRRARSQRRLAGTGGGSAFPSCSSYRRGQRRQGRGEYKSAEMAETGESGRFGGRVAVVTGAGGFIGRELCAALVADGAEVIG